VAVDWSQRGEYIVAKHQITSEQADEALVDPHRVVIDPDYNSKSGVSIRTFGYSPSRGELLSVTTVEDENGTIFGLNGWKPNTKDQRIYGERNER
jgi:hypothetical protein